MRWMEEDEHVEEEESDLEFAVRKMAEQWIHPRRLCPYFAHFPPSGTLRLAVTTMQGSGMQMRARQQHSRAAASTRGEDL